MSKRGNTYPLLFTISGQDLTDATEVILTLKPLNRPAIHFDREHMQLTSDGTDTTIAVKLTEEYSLGMDTVSYSADVNWMMDGTRGGTHIVTKPIDRTLYPKIIGGGDTTIDPNVAEPDPAELTSEEVRVVNAVSPHVTTEQVTGGAVITITDIDGTHTATVYDGQQGETGATGAQGPAGKDGKDGENGTDGISPTISVTDITGGHRVSITGAGGTQTFDVMDGEDGTNGTDGQDGTDGTNAYVYIRYAASEPTSDSDMKTTPDAWIGIYSGDAATAPTHYTDYVWYKIKGETGAAGQVQDVQVNGTSVVTSGVANIPLGGANTFGVLGYKSSRGLTIEDNLLRIQYASTADMKSGSDSFKPVTPAYLAGASFYGFATAAGDTTQKNSSNAVGTYTEDAKSAISEMLNGSVSVSGSTPSITAKAGIRYVCGEVSTLALTLPASGIVDVVFESGSTPTVLTITPPTGVTAVKWADGWDETCEANTTYELNILNGELGVKAAWT